MKAYIVSLGCPKNLTDTEILMAKLSSEGYGFTNDPSRADLILVNTCAFLRSARKEALSVIREMVKWKKKGKCKKLYVAGCLPKWMNRYGRGDRGEGVDGIIDSIDLFDYHTPRLKATYPWLAYVKISEGCDNRCSYCMIPTIRGPLKHRKMGDILKEAQMLAKAGVKELIYVAQDTTAYPNFPLLLKKTARIKGIKWIRILYAHPAHVTEDLLKTMAREPKIVKYLDLPLQHICDKILQSMKRRVSRLKIELLIAKIRRLVPGITLRTSFIVGYPGETHKDFESLLHFIKDYKFERLGIFEYSREKGTPAYNKRGQVGRRVKQKRYHLAMRAQNRVSLELNRKMIGCCLDVLVEKQVKAGFIGRSYMDAPEIDGSVLIKTTKALVPGRFEKVKVTGAKPYDLMARLVT